MPLNKQSENLKEEESYFNKMKKYIESGDPYVSLPEPFNYAIKNNYNKNVYSSILGKYINPTTGEVVETEEKI